MGFKNVKKIEIDDTDDIKEAMCGVVLLSASILFDSIENKKYTQARNDIDMLKCATLNLEYTLERFK